ncbi:MAG: phosphoribosylformylglycinamidine cyclo-ligase [Chloroflexi bacterium]|nr:phosphoribosylformylglycinamidine cyclo-ligase [Chloroflexota bacterium]
METEPIKESYVQAGVNIALAAKAKELIGKHARSTRRPGVLGELGFFGGLFELKGYEKPVLVSSVDGVGTKLKVACALAKHDTIGIDIVNHCINDILTCGAEPLFFLDYIAMGRLVAKRVEAIAQGLAQACREAGCALIGGETAEMPGLYAGEDYDLVGFIIGVAEKEQIITGETIAVGDAIIGLPSSGLHTNGYSLVRRIFGETRTALKRHYPELGRTLGEELLEPHRAYYPQLKPLLPLVRGIAHITGGGLIGNIPRILPKGVTAQLRRGQWLIPPIFQLIQARGNVDQPEMYRVFNMGIGMVLVCSPEKAGQLNRTVSEACVSGEVVPQKGRARAIIDRASIREFRLNQPTPKMLA